MKRVLILASLLLSTFSAHATTVVAEDTAEHTINFTFGRPTADSYLCNISLYGSQGSPLDTLTFPGGDSINGDSAGSGNFTRSFTRETSPASSTLHLGSANYGTYIIFRFCHDFQVPSSNPGGMLDFLYKIQTPASWSYFTNSQAEFRTNNDCSVVGSWVNNGWSPLSPNTNSDYIPLASTPFGEGQAVETTQGCYTSLHIIETSHDPRPANETAGQVTVGVKTIINYN